MISKWINKLEITDEVKNSYEFKLLFRGSRDGFTCGRFRKFCGVSRTVTIVKVKDSDEILGGYNPTKWERCSFNTTKDSFIFSFKNSDRIEKGNYILSRVVNEKNAIYDSYFDGPSFGDGDLTIWPNWGDTCNSKNISYEKPIRESNGVFFVEECEIFQIL